MAGMNSSSSSEKKKKEESTEEGEKGGGELLFCGATTWDINGRLDGNLLSPTRLRPLVGINIRFVASGCASCHCVALDVEGRCYTWGRNEKGQLGHGDMIQRDRPTVVSGLSKHKIVKAGAGRCHTVVVSDDGRSFGKSANSYINRGPIRQDSNWVTHQTISPSRPLCQVGSVCTDRNRGPSLMYELADFPRSFAFGWNKHGQLGLGTIAKNGFVSVEVESSPLPCVMSDEVTNIACGTEFTVWLSSTEGASILTAGLPQYGQLGHGTDHEFNTKETWVKLAYEAQPRPKAIASLAGETIVKVACGTNHTVAVDKNGFVYTWGCGGYGRLGHMEQKDEWSPRRVEFFQRRNVLPPNAIVSAGSANSFCTAGGGQLYMWGKVKNNGENWMYPKPMMDLSGWNLHCMDTGSMHHFVGADSSCISWGHFAQNGELGYGPNGQKSSVAPKKVDILEGMHVMGVACGSCHSMVIVDRTDITDRLVQLEIYDGKESLEESVDPKEEIVEATKKQPARRGATKKRKASKASSESEQDSDEENSSKEKEAQGSDRDYSEDGEEEANGKKQSTRGRGRGRGGRGRGGRTANGKASPVKTGGRRGRPRKS